MRILFVIRSVEFFHYYKSISAALQKKEHFFKLLFDKNFSDGGIDGIKANGFPCDWAVSRLDFFGKILAISRDLLSSQRYFKTGDLELPLPFKKDWLNRLPFWFRVFLKLPGAKRFILSGVFAHSLEWLEKVLPPSRAISDDIKKFGPDLVVVSPVTFRGSSAEVEYLKSARVLGIKTALPVISWDNLTARGLMHILPDRLFVWNETQKKEAEKYMNFPEEKIRIIGAPCFDVWFNHGVEPMSREKFCESYGLRAEDPIVLYLGSSRNIARDETWLIKDIKQAFESSKYPELRKTQIIFRPHPGYAKPYKNFSVKNVPVLPRNGALPEAEEDLKLFLNSIHHSIAVIEINTSGIIDTIIAGKPAIAMMVPEYASSREGTLHFRQLLEAGALEEVLTPEECAETIYNLMKGIDMKKINREKFIKNFIRPHDINISAGEKAVFELEELIKQK